MNFDVFQQGHDLFSVLLFFISETWVFYTSFFKISVKNCVFVLLTCQSVKTNKYKHFVFKTKVYECLNRNRKSFL